MSPIRLCVFILFFAVTALSQQERSIIIRCDDIGMCHTVNSAMKTVLDTGLPVSASVMFACPWYQEAVELLKGRSNVSVGVHLTLNAEWQNYRWGPVAGRSAVPTLVDAQGFFFPSRDALFANTPDPGEIERELRAQIERARASGLRIEYLDYHMGAAVSTPELRHLVEKLAREYRLGVSRWLGEGEIEGWYAAPIESKKDTLLQRMSAAAHGTGASLLVFHIGLETPEMDALVDMNSFGLKQMSRHRSAELHALTSPEFLALIKAQKVRLMTYGDLIREVGLDKMRRPAD